MRDAIWIFLATPPLLISGLNSNKVPECLYFAGVSLIIGEMGQLPNRIRARRASLFPHRSALHFDSDRFRNTSSSMRWPLIFPGIARCVGSADFGDTHRLYMEPVFRGARISRLCAPSFGARPSRLTYAISTKAPQPAPWMNGFRF